VGFFLVGLYSLTITANVLLFVYDLGKFIKNKICQRLNQKKNPLNKDSDDLSQKIKQGDQSDKSSVEKASIEKTV
jgi:hypothetical protein